MDADTTLYYRSFEDLNRLVRTCADKLPSDIDVVVGIPRSGLLVANLIALQLHVPLADLHGFARGEVLYGGIRLSGRSAPAAFRKALVVDDSVSSGAQLRAARQKLKDSRIPLLYAAAYAVPESLHMVDFAFEVLPQPRVFEWNVLNGEILNHACVDIDGILRRGPTDEVNEDGDRYLALIAGAALRCRPPCRIKHLVTDREERYRTAMQEWLAANGIEYEKLWMPPSVAVADRPTAPDRAAFKARVYLETGAQLFIESSEMLAREIAETARRQVFCTETHQMIYPGREPGAIMTFPGRTPPGVRVPLTWFVRQAGMEAGHRLVTRLAQVVRRIG